MLKGYVESRTAQRIPFMQDLAIRLEKDGAAFASGTATDISAGGIQFVLPWGHEVLSEGERIEIQFELPVIGTTLIRAEVRHFRYGINTEQHRFIYYGAKFLDLTLETWECLYDFCQPPEPAPDEAAETPRPKTPAEEKERKDIRVSANIPAQVQLPDGRSILGIIEDISYGGVRVRLPEEIVKDTPLTITPLTKSEPFTVGGVCAWTKSHAPASPDFSCGVFFNRLDTDQFNQLRTLIFKLAQAEPVESP
jgi:c-di-GMP-binding flagellar brake protein YcgR